MGDKTELVGCMYSHQFSWLALQTTFVSHYTVSDELFRILSHFYHSSFHDIHPFCLHLVQHPSDITSASSLLHSHRHRPDNFLAWLGSGPVMPCTVVFDNQTPGTWVGRLGFFLGRRRVRR
jgi:hypothetical protein